MTTLEAIKNIDFGPIYSYIFKDDGIFYTLNESSLTIQELCNITNILTNLNITYHVDDKYNIKVRID